MSYTKYYEILKYNRNQENIQEDIVIIEYPFTIFINDKEIITLLCTPKSLKELTLGFLHSEGFINGMESIEKIHIDEENGRAYVYLNKRNTFNEKLWGKRTITSGCGKGTVFYNVIDSFKSKKIESPISIDKDMISNMMRDFNKRSELFQLTGGVHSCGLYDRNGMIIFEEDIGRHNALDKVLGKALEDRIELKDKIILTSGRISSEILIKTGKRGISTIVSRSAPTSLAIDIAKELNINLIGFVRADKMNIYTNIPRLDS
ncbi:formate dehydrogenase accessory sulfurtransferase FdhD [Wansuia hejianensis]|uniref:Sulfur carrier protein FdhD n=1 Tax=Wansuia hejianensis TaxID=2763667 RepID=A0A926EW65_9FIRM|nr:formate dehydrogenase accessory sulfurtransferase FdhD [Wansuia hejianensis]MBC8590988.1 formate dehydrogenase accessory sulfurtransferase FdhD [Wansuia hejianensis]